MDTQHWTSEVYNRIEPRNFSRQEIAQMVVAGRTLRHWSQETLAENAHITVRTLQRVEAGDSIVGVETLRRIEKALDLPDALFTSPVKMPTAAQLEAIESEFNAKYLRLDATELASAQQLVAFVGSISACQPSHDECDGTAGLAIADLLSYIGDLVELSALDDCDMRQRFAIAEDLKPLVTAVHDAGLRIFSTVRRMRFGARPGVPGIALQTGYIRITSAPMKMFLFERDSGPKES